MLSRGRPHWSEHALVARLHARLGGEPLSTLGSEFASRELHLTRIKFRMMAGASPAERQQAARELRAMAEAWPPITDSPLESAKPAAWAALWFVRCSACGWLGLVLDDKVRLHRALRRAGPAAAALAPRSFDAGDAEEMAAFRVARRQAPRLRWLVRDGLAGDGRGTSLLQPGHEPPAWRRHAIVSQLIEDPLLVEGAKSELRVYAVVESATPELRVHLYQRWFLVRLAGDGVERGASGLDSVIFTNSHRDGRMVPPQGLIAAAEARSGRPWAHTWAQIEALVGATVVAALQEAEREGARQTRHNGEADAGASAPSCEHTVVAFDVILAGDTAARGGGVAKRADARTEFGAGGADAGPLRPLRPFLIEASNSFGFAAHGSDGKKSQGKDDFSRDLLFWLVAQAEGAGVHACRPRHEQPAEGFHFRRIVPPCIGQGGGLPRKRRHHRRKHTAGHHHHR